MGHKTKNQTTYHYFQCLTQLINSCHVLFLNGCSHTNYWQLLHVRVLQYGCIQGGAKVWNHLNIFSRALCMIFKCSIVLWFNKNYFLVRSKFQSWPQCRAHLFYLFRTTILQYKDLFKNVLPHGGSNLKKLTLDPTHRLTLKFQPYQKV